MQMHNSQHRDSEDREFPSTNPDHHLHSACIPFAAAVIALTNVVGIAARSDEECVSLMIAS